jgi:archaellum component FlaG (FlaF/FlaG flagellin family)
MYPCASSRIGATSRYLVYVVAIIINSSIINIIATSTNSMARDGKAKAPFYIATIIEER